MLVPYFEQSLTLKALMNVPDTVALTLHALPI